MRNTKAFKDASAQTLAELARRGVTLRPGTVEDVIERNMTAVAAQLGIQVRSAWRYFDPAGLADTLAQQQQDFADSSAENGAGHAPMPPLNNPELALLLAGVPDALVETGGDLYAVILNVAVNAWMAGHIHGEDGCTGCEGNRGPSGHDWQARMDAIAQLSPGITKWFDSDVWNAALHDSGFSVVRR